MIIYQRVVNSQNVDTSSAASQHASVPQVDPYHAGTDNSTPEVYDLDQRS